MDEDQYIYFIAGTDEFRVGIDGKIHVYRFRKRWYKTQARITGNIRQDIKDAYKIALRKHKLKNYKP